MSNHDGPIVPWVHGNSCFVDGCDGVQGSSFGEPVADSFIEQICQDGSQSFNDVGNKLGAQALMILGLTVMKLEYYVGYPFGGK